MHRKELVGQMLSTVLYLLVLVSEAAWNAKDVPCDRIKPGGDNPYYCSWLLFPASVLSQFSSYAAPQRILQI